MQVTPFPFHWPLPSQLLVFGGPCYTGSFCWSPMAFPGSSLGQDLKGFKPALPPKKSFTLTDSWSTGHLTHFPFTLVIGSASQPISAFHMFQAWVRHLSTTRKVLFTKSCTNNFYTLRVRELRTVKLGFDSLLWNSYKMVYWQHCYLISTALVFLAETSNLKSFYTCICWLNVTWMWCIILLLS